MKENLELNQFQIFWNSYKNVYESLEFLKIVFPWKIYDFEQDCLTYRDLWDFIDRGIDIFDKEEKYLEIKYLEGEENHVYIDCEDNDILYKFLNFLFEVGLLPKINFFTKNLISLNRLLEFLSYSDFMVEDEISFTFNNDLTKQEFEKIQDIGTSFNIDLYEDENLFEEDCEKTFYFFNLWEKNLTNEEIKRIIQKVNLIKKIKNVNMFITKDFSLDRYFSKIPFDNVFQFKITLLKNKPHIWRRIQVPEIYTFEDLHVAIQNAMGWNDEHLHEFNMINPKTGFKARILYTVKDLDFYLEFESYLLRNMDKIRKMYLNVKEWKESNILNQKWDEIKQILGDDLDFEEVFGLSCYYDEPFGLSYCTAKKQLNNKISFEDYIKFQTIYYVMHGKSPIEYYQDKNVKISEFFNENNDKCRYIYDFGEEWTHLIKLENILPRKEGVIYPISLAGERACPLENTTIHESLRTARILKNPSHPEYNEILDWSISLSPPHWIGKVEKYDLEYFNVDDVYFEDPPKHMKRVTSRS